jgi:hypothetical protein
VVPSLDPQDAFVVLAAPIVSDHAVSPYHELSCSGQLLFALPMAYAGPEAKEQRQGQK